MWLPGSFEFIFPLFFLVGIAGMGLCIWAVIDALKHHDSVWESTGQTKMPWVLALAIGFFASWLGFAVSVYYLVKIRPQLMAAEQGV